MVDTTKMAKLLESFAQAVAAHDRENPGHSSWGIGMNNFDIERLGLEEGEQILPGIVLQTDDGVTGNFRVLCDGEHDLEVEEEEQEALDAIAEQEIEEQIVEPAYSPGPGAPPRVRPPI